MQEWTSGLDGERWTGGGGRDKETGQRQSRHEGDETSEKRRWKDKQRGAKSEILSAVKEPVKLLTQPSKACSVGG